MLCHLPEDLQLAVSLFVPLELHRTAKVFRCPKLVKQVQQHLDSRTSTTQGDGGADAVCRACRTNDVAALASYGIDNLRLFPSERLIMWAVCGVFDLAKRQLLDFLFDRRLIRYTGYDERGWTDDIVGADSEDIGTVEYFMRRVILASPTPLDTTTFVGHTACLAVCHNRLLPPQQTLPQIKSRLADAGVDWTLRLITDLYSDLESQHDDPDSFVAFDSQDEAVLEVERQEWRRDTFERIIEFKKAFGLYTEVTAAEIQQDLEWLSELRDFSSYDADLLRRARHC